MIYRTRYSVFQHVRAECRTFAIGDECLPEARPGGTIYSDAPYGRNWTAPTKPLSLAFRFHTAAELGSDPRGETTASPASFRSLPTPSSAAFSLAQRCRNGT